MTDRYDELRVTPDPARAEELRRRLHRRMEQGLLDDLAAKSRLGLDIERPEPATEFVPMEEMHMTVESPDNKHTNRWWIVAAAAVVAVVGLAAIALVIDRDDADDDGVQDEPATTDAPTTTTAPVLTTGFFAGGGDGVPVTYLVPDGWETFGGGWAVISADDSAGVNFFDVANVYADGCQWELLDPPLGPSVDDLATSWAGLAGYTATPPVDVTVDGYGGKQVEFTVPDYDEDDCPRGEFAMWTEDEMAQSSPSFWAQSPLQRNRQLILDVDGTRLVITALSTPDASPDDLAAIDQILASVQIG